MGTRPTRKAGLLKNRHSDPELNKTLNPIIERIEVLDGLRGDALDQAVTYRDLGLSGFDISVPFSGGTPQIINIPGTGGGAPVPTVGPAAKPTNLRVSETWLALQLVWDNPSINLQHIEVWRSLTDNLSTAEFIGTTVSPLYMDYVGAEASFYYWVRAVGTDGTYSPYNDTAGTLGTTGVDPSDWEANITISTENLSDALAARIDLIDFPITGLVDRMAVTEGDVLAAESNINSLQSSVAGLTVISDGYAVSINANANNILTNQTTITSVQTDVIDVEGNVSTLTTQVAANSSSILNLEASIGAIDSGGGQTWDFLADVDGFTTSNATLTAGGGIAVFTPSASNPQLVSETVSLSGGVYTQVVVRIRQTIGGGSWEGNCYYQTSGHGFNGSYVKSIPNPNLVLSEWTILTWDMSNLDAGADDWLNNTIEAIRLDFVSDNGGKFEIDYVLIAKFSTTAITEALDAIDVRVTSNEGAISAQGTAITSLESTVDDPTTGLVATAAAVTGLTTDVSQNQTDISANAVALQAVETTVNDGNTGVAANASAISQLETSVTNAEGSLVSQSQSITQIVASIDGGFGSLVNPLNVQFEGYGTTWSDPNVITSNVGGRAQVAGVSESSGSLTQRIKRASTNERLFIEPNAIYEFRASWYHRRPNNAGSTLLGFRSYIAASGGTNQLAAQINTGVAGGSTTSPTWVEARNTAGDDEWFDISGYILGADVDPSQCPYLRVNGVSNNAAGFTAFGFTQSNDGFKVQAFAPFVEIVAQNLNTSPTYGDGTSTTQYISDVSFRRVDSEAALFSAISVESSVRAEETGDLSALYAVKVSLSTNDDPYIVGFGIAADIIGGQPTSSFGIRADQFFIASPDYGNNPGTEPGSNGESAYPFVVEAVNGSVVVGIDGELIVDGTVRTNALNAKAVTAGKINVETLDAISANVGVLVGGTITTAGVVDRVINDITYYEPDTNAFRVELEAASLGGNPWPIWYGSGLKSAPSGLFYVDLFGNVTIKGLLDAGMIKQSYFTPALTNFDSFKIACDYVTAGHPSYSGGVYTGKAAHLRPLLTTGFASPINSNGTEVYDRTNYNTSTNLSQKRCGYQTDWLTFYGPTSPASVTYARLGTLTENIILRYSAECHHAIGPPYDFWIIVQYQYDAEPIRQAYIRFVTLQASMRTAHFTSEDVFVTRSTSWATLKLRLAIGCERSDENSGSLVRATAANVNFTAECTNFGYADQAVNADVTGSTIGSTSILLQNPATRRRFL